MENDSTTVTGKHELYVPDDDLFQDCDDVEQDSEFKEQIQKKVRFNFSAFKRIRYLNWLLSSKSILRATFDHYERSMWFLLHFYRISHNENRDLNQFFNEENVRDFLSVPKLLGCFIIFLITEKEDRLREQFENYVNNSQLVLRLREERLIGPDDEFRFENFVA